MGRRARLVKRVCTICNSTVTYTDKAGRQHWYNHNSKWYCEKCECRLFKNPKWSKTNNKRRIKFRRKYIYLDKNPRIGRCKKCGNKIGQVKRTSMHHTEYDESHPLNHTIELCNSCHGKITRSLIHSQRILPGSPFEFF
jgi:hypothetical protein